MPESYGTASTHRAGRGADLRVDQIGDDVNVRGGLGDPVLAGDACLEGAVLDVPRHLLCASDGAFDLIVVDLGEVAPRADVDLPPRPVE